MSLTLLAWFVTFVVLAAFALTRSATYGLSLYLFTFFISPLFWWWGNDTIGAYRWNLAAAIIFAVAVLLDQDWKLKHVDAVPMWPQMLAIGFLANATMVNFLLSPNVAVGFERYLLAVKFVVLFLVLAPCIRDAKALRLALWSITLGAGYIGYEATINDRGQFSGGRLEGIGAAGVQNANELAALMAIVLPLTAGLFFTGSRREKIAVAIVGPMILNVVLLCNSRGTFLALLGGAVVFLITSWGPARKKVLRGFALGAVAVVLLLRDPEIVDRFMTVFVSEQEMDASASERLLIWGVALRVLRAHPLGTGGDGFNRFYSREYLETGRSVHNGFLSEAVEWGVQGVALKLLVVFTGVWLVVRTAWRGTNNAESILLASSLTTSMAVLLGASLFGDYLDEEWAYWIVGLMLGYARAYSPPRLTADSV
jgi:putative inorganic carbon (hco3(-)) transporter